MTDMLFVAGLGRCGSSMVCAMLRAGGARVLGRAPAFEVDAMNHACPGPARNRWLAQHPRAVVKWLDPHKVPVSPAIRGPVIWLTRDVQQQAASQIKFLETMGAIPLGAIDRAGRRRFAAQLRTEERQARAALAGRAVLPLTFEAVLAAPAAAAVVITGFAAVHGFVLNAAAMARVVLPRDPACARDMRIEMAGIEAQR